MMKRKTKKIRLINIKRLFFLPLLITTLITIASGVVTYMITLTQSRAEFLSRGLSLSNSYSMLVSRNYEYETHTMDDFNKRILSTAHIVLKERDFLSNEILQEISDLTGVTYIWWYSPTGEVLFDSTGEEVGWTPTEGDPIYNFVHSDLTYLLEGIRLSVDESKEFLTGFVRADNGYFVQVAIDVSEVLIGLETVSPLRVVTDIVKSNDEVYYASILDKDGLTIASTLPGRTSDDYLLKFADRIDRTLKGEAFGVETYNTNFEKKILEVFTPIVYEDEIINILVIGYSLDIFISFTWNATILIVAAIFLIDLAYILAVYLSVVMPLKKLDRAVLSFNPKTGEYTRPQSNYKVFSKLYDSFDIVGKRFLEANELNSELTDEVQKLAYTDFLTNTPNRLSLEKVINIKTHLGKPFALIFIDIDDFKGFNDTKGHNFGDSLLICVTEHLKSLQKSLRFLIYRYGGDEFIIIKDYQSKCEIDSLINQIHDHFANGIFIEGDEYTLTLSMGISFYPEHGDTSNELIRKADIAMYNSKSVGDTIYRYYTEEMDRILQEEIAISQEIRRAFKRDGFKIVIQPQYDLKTGNIVSYEALARFKNHKIPPNKFITVAEKTNLINQIGRIVIEKTFIALRQQIEANITLHPIYVNLSAKQLSDPTLLDFIKEMAIKYDVDLHFFGIELTESSIIDNETNARETLQAIKNLGVKIAIDDFGSGQAGLNYLIKYPVEMVKIDRSFCLQYLQEDKVEVFRAVVHLAKLLGFQVLAEGIENKTQVALLKQTGCEFAQGYYYSKPFEVSKMLEDAKS